MSHVSVTSFLNVSFFRFTVSTNIKRLGDLEFHETKINKQRKKKKIAVAYNIVLMKSIEKFKTTVMNIMMQNDKSNSLSKYLRKSLEQ